MKTLKNIIAIIFGLFIVWSCQDDFVQEDPEFIIDAESFFNSPEDYEQALIGAYDLLQSTYLNVMLGEIASDNTLAGGESATDVIGIQEIDDMIHTPINQQLRDIWSWMYSGVNRSNFIIEFQDNISFEGQDQVIGQARFLRAYYMFELVKFFGDIPFIEDQRIQFGAQFELDRRPASEAYALMEADLQFAASVLSPVAAESGRVTSGAALALLGKILIFQDRFDEAATVLDQVINSGVYDLVTDYSIIFEQEGENNIESVFEIQYTDQEGAGFGCLQCSEGNVAVGFNGIRNYNGPIFDSGFSFNVPTQEVFDAFEPGDIRRETAILDIDAFAAQTGATFVEGFEHTGFYNRKYIARQGDLNTGDQNLTNPNNYRAIRFADVLLLGAEAHNRGSGNDETARLYLNRVRSRAQLPEVTASGPALTDAIYAERRVELVGEGHHFFDLVRTGRAAAEIDGFIQGRNELFPIPSIEIELAGNRWEQNPGY